jgi:hypothetical protein
LTSQFTQPHGEVAAQYLMAKFAANPNCTGRDVESLVLTAKNACRSETPTSKSKIICIRHIDAAFKRFNEEEQERKNKRKTEDERRDEQEKSAQLRHDETIAVQKDHFDEQLRLQVEIAYRSRSSSLSQINYLYIQNNFLRHELNSEKFYLKQAYQLIENIRERFTKATKNAGITFLGMDTHASSNKHLLPQYNQQFRTLTERYNRCQALLATNPNSSTYRAANISAFDIYKELQDLSSNLSAYFLA